MQKQFQNTLTIFLLLILGSCSVKNSDNQLLMSVLWFQKSAEARALYYQAYNLATIRVDNYTPLDSTKKQAVIVDIDETILDNSPYEGKSIKENFNYPYGWSEWIAKSSAQAMPGALPFLKHCDSLGISIFYVSNRKEDEKAATMKNLSDAGFPQISDKHMYLKTDESSKEPRRQNIAENYEIILLAGDNLNDFSDVFEKKSVEDRFDETDRLRNEFGKNFIVLPNPMYGEWEGAILGYQYSLPKEQKNTIKKEALVTY